MYCNIINNLHLCTPVSCRDISGQEIRNCKKYNRKGKAIEMCVVARDQVNSLKKEPKKEKQKKKRSTVGGNRSRSRRKRKGNENENENRKKKNDKKIKCRGLGICSALRFHVQFPGKGRSNRSL